MQESLSFLISIIKIIRRIKKRANIEFLEYGQLISLLFSFFIAIFDNNKTKLIIFIIVAVVVLVLRKVIDNKK